MSHRVPRRASHRESPFTEGRGFSSKVLRFVRTNHLFLRDAFLSMLLVRKVNVCGVVGPFLQVQLPEASLAAWLEHPGSLPPSLRWEDPAQQTAALTWWQRARSSGRAGDPHPGGTEHRCRELPGCAQGAESPGAESRSSSGGFDAMARVHMACSWRGGGAGGLVCLTSQGGRLTIGRPVRLPRQQQVQLEVRAQVWGSQGSPPRWTLPQQQRPWGWGWAGP